MSLDPAIGITEPSLGNNCEAALSSNSNAKGTLLDASLVARLVAHSLVGHNVSGASIKPK
jgi:hypothetical protein